MTNNTSQSHSKAAILWTTAGLICLGALALRIFKPELTAGFIALGVALLINIALIAREYKNALSGRTAAYTLNSAVTMILVLGLLGVLNFFASRYPKKFDLTSAQLHTLTDQTRKTVKGLTNEVTVTFYKKPVLEGETEKLIDLLRRYEDLNPLFKVELVDPNKEQARTKAAGVTKFNTVVLETEGKIRHLEKFDEEKLTNALIKFSSTGKQLLCAITGHGEKDLDSEEARGLKGLREALSAQTYLTQEINLAEKGKVPEECQAIALFGPDRKISAEEVAIIDRYLSEGGRALISIDIELQGKETIPELIPVLERWYVRPVKALTIDPELQLFGVSPAAPRVSRFSGEHPVSKDMTEGGVFPFSRPLMELSGRPPEIKWNWLARTSNNAWGETDFKKLAQGGQIKFDAGKDTKGPLTLALAISGRQKATQPKQETRIVVFGTTLFMNNENIRFGFNKDFAVNAVSWLFDNEKSISISSRKDAPGKIELSREAGMVIYYTTIFILPILIIVLGIVNWMRRRKL